MSHSMESCYKMTKLYKMFLAYFILNWFTLTESLKCSTTRRVKKEQFEANCVDTFATLKSLNVTIRLDRFETAGLNGYYELDDGLNKFSWRKKLFRWKRGKDSHERCIFYRITKKVVQVCCPGYEGRKCNKPICSPPCANGRCVVPDTCRCRLGYTGLRCIENKSSVTKHHRYCYKSSSCNGSLALDMQNVVQRSECCNGKGAAWGLFGKKCFECPDICKQYEFLCPHTIPLDGHITSSTCFSNGINYYRTFDGLEYLFDGKCIYTVFSNGICSVEVGMENCQDFLNCKKKLTIILNPANKIVVDNNVIRYNGEDITDHFMTNNVWTVESTGLIIELQDFIYNLQYGSFHIMWDMKSMWSITVDQASHKGKYHRVTGLCGNMDGNPQNDMKMPNRATTSSSTEFGDSWAVKRKRNKCEDTPEMVYNCPDEKAEIEAKEVCDTLNRFPFSECHEQVDVNFYFMRCVNDYCDAMKNLDGRPQEPFFPMGLDSVLCVSFGTYSFECFLHGTGFEWRNETFCPEEGVSGFSTTFLPQTTFTPSAICLVPDGFEVSTNTFFNNKFLVSDSEGEKDLSGMLVGSGSEVIIEPGEVIIIEPALFVATFDIWEFEFEVIGATNVTIVLYGADEVSVVYMETFELDPTVWSNIKLEVPVPVSNIKLEVPVPVSPPTSGSVCGFQSISRIEIGFGASNFPIRMRGLGLKALRKKYDCATGERKMILKADGTDFSTPFQFDNALYGSGRTVDNWDNNKPVSVQALDAVSDVCPGPYTLQFLTLKVKPTKDTNVEVRLFDESTNIIPPIFLCSVNAGRFRRVSLPKSLTDDPEYVGKFYSMRLKMQSESATAKRLYAQACCQLQEDVHTCLNCLAFISATCIDPDAVVNDTGTNFVDGVYNLTIADMVVASMQCAIPSTVTKSQLDIMGASAVFFDFHSTNGTVLTQEILVDDPSIWQTIQANIPSQGIHNAVEVVFTFNTTTNQKTPIYVRNVLCIQCCPLLGDDDICDFNPVTIETTTPIVTLPETTVQIECPVSPVDLVLNISSVPEYFSVYGIGPFGAVHPFSPPETDVLIAVKDSGKSIFITRKDKIVIKNICTDVTIQKVEFIVRNASSSTVYFLNTTNEVIYQNTTEAEEVSLEVNVKGVAQIAFEFRGGSKMEVKGLTAVGEGCCPK